MNPVPYKIPYISPRFWLKILLLKQLLTNEINDFNVIDVIQYTHNNYYIDIISSNTPDITQLSIHETDSITQPYPSSHETGKLKSLLAV
jgi:hypothetical protein